MMRFGELWRRKVRRLRIRATSRARSHHTSGCRLRRTCGRIGERRASRGAAGHFRQLRATEDRRSYDFDPGFDLHASGLSGVLKGVRDGGPAYRAGLREGETFSRHLVSPLAWQPITITIRDGSGEHQVKYFPQGAAHAVPQYVPIMPAARFNECFRAGKLDS